MPTAELQGAPPAVQAAAADIAQHQGLRRRTSLGLTATLLVGLLSTSLLHDLAGWSALTAAVPLLLSLAVVVAGVVWLIRGPLRDLPAKESLLARYRALQELGLPLEASAAVRAEDTSALEILCARIDALAGDRGEVRAAAHVARDHALRLEHELGHLTQVLAAQPALAAQLAGVRERVEGEVARTRARLAETYAALLALESQPPPDLPGLEDALLRLQADAEVGVRSHGPRAKQSLSG